MRIQELLRRTGLTRKKVYYYIREGLISPARESGNGYLCFTPADAAALCAVGKLRALDIPVENIRSILEFPSTANYYLIRRLKELKREKAKLAWQETCIQEMLDSVGPEESHEQLLARLESIGQGGPADEAVDLTDARLMASYFWGMFMRGVEMTEYRRFLWDRLLKYVVAHPSPDLTGLRNYLSALSQQEIQELFARHNEFTEQVTALTETGYEAFIFQMIPAIAQQLKKPSNIRTWKKRYVAFIRPAAGFFDSAAGEILREFSPRFASYQRNVNACCLGVKEYLESPAGAALYQELMNKLGGYIDISANHSGELAALASFLN